MSKSHVKEAYIELGLILRKARLDRGITQLELAELLGYNTPQFVSLYERGLSKVPMKTIGKLIGILGISETHVTKILHGMYLKLIESELNLGKKTVGKRK